MLESLDKSFSSSSCFCFAAGKLCSEKNRKSSVGDFEVGHCCSIGNTLTPCVCLCVWREFATDIMMMMQSRFNKKNFQSLKNAFQMMHKFIKLPSRFNYINFQVENCPLPRCIPLCFAVEKFVDSFFLSILSLVWLYFFRCGLGQWSAGPCETFSSCHEFHMSSREKSVVENSSW